MKMMKLVLLLTAIAFVAIHSTDAATKIENTASKEVADSTKAYHQSEKNDMADVTIENGDVEDEVEDEDEEDLIENEDTNVENDVSDPRHYYKRKCSYVRKCRYSKKCRRVRRYGKGYYKPRYQIRCRPVRRCRRVRVCRRVRQRVTKY